jgi:hypothetical protein
MTAPVCSTGSTTNETLTTTFSSRNETRQAVAEQPTTAVIQQFHLRQGVFDLQMPKDARIVDVRMAIDGPALWAICDPLAEMESRSFKLMSTGGTFDPSGLVYRGTFQSGTGVVVGHLFEQVGK